MGQQFDTLDVMRLEVEKTPTGPVNLIQNMSGEFGSWGWVTPLSGTALSGTGAGGLQVLSLNRGATTSGYFYSENLPVSAGQYAASYFRASANSTNSVQFEFLDAAGAVVGTSATQAVLGNTGPGLGGTPNSYAAVQAPAGTVRARLRFNYGNFTFFYLASVTVAKADAAAALAGLGILQPATYTDILGPAHSISIKRTELDVGVLTAEILDATLDPSQSDLVRPGKRVRVTVSTQDSVARQPLFTGKITSGSTKYDLGRTDEKRARITLVAVDAASALAQVPRAEGVGTIRDLPWVLEGSGVPWNVNGSGNQITTTPTVVASNDNAFAIDQVAIVRDTSLGYAWVNRLGVLTVWDRALLPAAVAGVLNEEAYSAVDLDYDTDRCINVVTVKYRRVNIANGETVEVAYGPYVNQASVDRWGPHSAEFTVQGLTDTEGATAAYAAEILAANATPQVRLNSITFPVVERTDLVAGRAMLDLYDLVTVQNARGGIDSDVRVTSLEHTITPGKWIVSLGFTADNSVASPQQTPSLSSPVGAASPTFQCGDNVVGTDGSGRGTITFPIPFAVKPVVVPVGGNGESITTIEPSATATPTDFSFIAYGQTGAPIAFGGVRVRWIAMSAPAL